MDFFNKIPVMDRTALRELKKGIDSSFKEFSRAYGDGIEGFFDPLLHFLIWLEKLLVNSPWPLVIGMFAILAWIGSRSIKLVIGTVVCFIVIGYFGMWKKLYGNSSNHFRFYINLHCLLEFQLGF
jgi:ABC-type proline/glycine betaine transport system, permease component